MTLGIVINKLATGAALNKTTGGKSSNWDKVRTSVVKNAGHIPFRDSKLTRILQPALGGRARYQTHLVGIRLSYRVSSYQVIDSIILPG